MRHCPDCQALVEDDATFCDNCGYSLTPQAQVSAPPGESAPGAAIASGAPAPEAGEPPGTSGTPVPGEVAPGTCSSCGYVNVPGEMFCQNCGVQLAPVASMPPPLPMPISSSQAQASVSEPKAAPGESAGIFCPNCGSPYSPGEAVCPNCGHQLNSPEAKPFYSTGSKVPSPVAAAPPVTLPSTRTPVTKLGLITGKFVVQPAGTIVRIPQGKAEIIIGRSDPVRNIYPDIDLSIYGGDKSGVSRTHARLIAQGGQLYLEDLNSTNFTFLNKEKLRPGQWYPVKFSDEMRFGLLTLQFLEV